MIRSRIRTYILTFIVSVLMLFQSTVTKASELNAEELVSNAIKYKTFYHFNVAYTKVMSLPETSEKYKLLNELTPIQSLVWTDEINKSLAMITDMAKTGSAKTYDEVVSYVTNSKLGELDKGYLLGELSGWGKKLVYTTDYVEALNALNEAWARKDTDSILKSENLIKFVQNKYNREYLQDELKSLKDRVTIKSIEDIYVTINQNEKYSLPGTVVANMEDGTTQTFYVSWEQTQVNTQKVGIIVVYGTVPGYDKKIKVTVKVLSNTSRQNPAEVGDKLYVDTKYESNLFESEIVVSEIIRGNKAWEKVLNANTDNDPPKKGYEYLLAKISFKVNKASNKNAYIELSKWRFKLVSSSGKEYPTCTVDDLDPKIDAYLYEGASIEGWMPFIVEKDDMTPVIAFGRNYDGTGGIWFKAYTNDSK